ncbi:MAG: AMP-binding protein [Pseudonocardiaceae bacterium]
MSHAAPAARAITITAALADLDLRSNDRVLIMLADGVGFVEAFVDVTRWGAVPLSVNPRLAAADVAAIAAKTGARLLLTSTKRLQHLAELDAGPPVLVDGRRGLWAIPLHPR